MTRLILTDLDLSGQTIKGQPFSYIGRCRGTDIKFIGDWKHVSHYHNDFLRPDWSKAETRYSYSLLNTFTDGKPSSDVDQYDYDMMIAVFEEGMGKLKPEEKEAIQPILTKLRGYKAEVSDLGSRLSSWQNLAGPVLDKLKGETRAREVFAKAVGNRAHLLALFDENINADRLRPSWAEEEEPSPPEGGVVVSNWGVVARHHLTGQEYHKHWSELPHPTRPNDRVEMAELIEAEVEKVLGYPCTVHVQSIQPWAGYAVMGRHPRDWWMR